MLSSDLEHVRNGFQNVVKKAVNELDASIAEKARLEAKIQELKEKLKETSGVEEDICTAIQGSWSIVSSTGMKEYLQKWGARKEIDAIFQVGTQNFEVEGDVVTMSNTIGITEHWKGKYVLGVKKNGAIVTVDGNMLVSIYFADESREEYMRLERFVKNGQLHIVTKRFGLTCTRIYEKIGAKDFDASKRIAELEAELEKLNLERKSDKEEVIKEKEETERIRGLFASRERILFEEISKLEKEKEEMKKELDELKKTAVETDPTEIKTAILGTWRLVESSSAQPTSQTIIFFMEDGHITESNAMGDKRTSWVLNDSFHSYNYSLFAHTVDMTDKLATDFYTKWGGAFEFSIERRIVNGSLEIVKVTKNGKYETSVYMRVG